MAKRFQFRLARILKLRERERERRRLAHAEALQYRERVAQQITNIEQVRAEEKSALRAAMAEKTFPLDRVIAARTYESVLIRLGQYLERQMHQIEEVVAGRRNELMLAERDVRILEKLEEKLRGRYARAMDLEEQQTLDEVAAAGRARESLLRLAEIADSLDSPESPDSTEAADSMGA